MPWSKLSPRGFFTQTDWSGAPYSLCRCPNPLDPSPHNVVLPSPGSQTRRFIITTFKFLRKGKPYELNQEVGVCVCVL